MRPLLPGARATALVYSLIAASVAGQDRASSVATVEASVVAFQSAQRDLTSPVARLVGHWVGAQTPRGQTGPSHYYFGPTDRNTDIGRMIVVDSDGTEKRQQYRLTSQTPAGEAIRIETNIGSIGVDTSDLAKAARDWSCVITKDGQSLDTTVRLPLPGAAPVISRSQLKYVDNQIGPR